MQMGLQKKHTEVTSSMQRKFYEKAVTLFSRATYQSRNLH